MDAATSLAIADALKNKKAMADAAAMANRNEVTSGNSIIPDERSLMHAKGMEDQFTQQAQNKGWLDRQRLANEGDLAEQQSRNQGAMDLALYSTPRNAFTELAKTQMQSDNKLYPYTRYDADGNPVEKGYGPPSGGTSSGSTTSPAPSSSLDLFSQPKASTPAKPGTTAQPQTSAGSSPAPDWRTPPTVTPEKSAAQKTREMMDQSGMFGGQAAQSQPIDVRTGPNAANNGSAWAPSAEGLRKYPGGGMLKVEDGSGRAFQVAGDGFTEVGARPGSQPATSAPTNSPASTPTAEAFMGRGQGSMTSASPGQGAAAGADYSMPNEADRIRANRLAASQQGPFTPVAQSGGSVAQQPANPNYNAALTDKAFQAGQSDPFGIKGFLTGAAKAVPGAVADYTPLGTMARYSAAVPKAAFDWIKSNSTSKQMAQGGFDPQTGYSTSSDATLPGQQATKKPPYGQPPKGDPTPPPPAAPPVYDDGYRRKDLSEIWKKQAPRRSVASTGSPFASFARA